MAQPAKPRKNRTADKGAASSASWSWTATATTPRPWRCCCACTATRPAAPRTARPYPSLRDLSDRVRVAQLGQRAEVHRRRSSVLRARTEEATVRWEISRSRCAARLELGRGYCAYAARFLGRGGVGSCQLDPRP